MNERDKWEAFAQDYDSKVFSLTSVPQRRKQILRMVKKGRVLNLGAGSTNYLNKDLLQTGNQVVASDFCKKMLEVAKEGFQDPNLEHVVADSRVLPFSEKSFDTVVSVNSILPPEREQVTEIFGEIYRVLKPGGRLVAFLTSYENALKAIENLGLEIEVDKEGKRIRDTSGWQCFHTTSQIEDQMSKLNFSNSYYQKVFLKTKQEIEELKRLYGADTSKSLIFEYFLVATK